MDLSEINEFMKPVSWMDFELISVDPQTVELHGFIDEAYNDKLIIIFSSVYMLCAPLSFTYDGTGDFISVADKKQSISINKAYDVTFGNNVFVFSNTDIQGDMFIVAKQFGMKVINL